MDMWWLKFNLELLFTEILARVPFINKLPLSLVKSYKQAYELIKGRASWLIDVTAPSIFVFENLDYLLQSPITIDEIMFENKYPPEMKLYLERLLDIMVSLGYVAKEQDTYVLTKPIGLKFTPEYQKFMDHELGATPSGREHVLLHDIYSSQKLARSRKSSAVRRLGLVPNFYVFSNFILPFLRDLSINSIGFAGGYVLSIIPLLNYFSSSKFTYFEHNPLVLSKLLKLIKSMSPNAVTRLNIVKKNIFVERKEGKLLLRRGFEISRGEKLFVIEDVITTAKSATETARIAESYGGISGYACIVDRSDNKTGLDIQSLYQISPVIYKPSDCPMCKRNIPVIKPGSKAKVS